MSDFPQFQKKLGADIPAAETGPDPDLREAERDAQIKDIKVRSRIKLTVLLVFTLIGAIIISVYVWHLVGPERWRWLEDHEITAIKDLALSIATGVSLSLATKFTIK